MPLALQANLKLFQFGGSTRPGGSAPPRGVYPFRSVWAQTPPHSMGRAGPSRTASRSNAWSKVRFALPGIFMGNLPAKLPYFSMSSWAERGTFTARDGIFMGRNGTFVRDPIGFSASNAAI